MTRAQRLLEEVDPILHIVHFEDMSLGLNRRGSTTVPEYVRNVHEFLVTNDLMHYVDRIVEPFDFGGCVSVVCASQRDAEQLVERLDGILPEASRAWHEDYGHDATNAVYRRFRHSQIWWIE